MRYRLLASRGMAPGQPWLDMPEVEAVHRLRASGAELETGHDSTLLSSVHSAKHVLSLGGTRRAARLFLTFIAAMDRARDAIQLWNAEAGLYKDHPESFDPQHVAGLEVSALGRVLKAARVSRRHGPDSNAWHQIAKSLSSGLDSPVSRVIDAGSGGAEELLRDVVEEAAPAFHRDTHARTRHRSANAPLVNWEPWTLSGSPESPGPARRPAPGRRTTRPSC